MSRLNCPSNLQMSHSILSGDNLQPSITLHLLIPVNTVLCPYFLFSLFVVKSAPTAVNFYSLNFPENCLHIFREHASTRKISRENYKFFLGPKTSDVLRNTRNCFRELFGCLSGPVKFPGLLRNARLVLKSYGITNCYIPGSANVSPNVSLTLLSLS